MTTKFKKFIPFILNENLKSINYPEGITYEDAVTFCYIILQCYSKALNKEVSDGRNVSIAAEVFRNGIGDKRINKKELYYILTLLLEDAGIITVLKKVIPGVKSYSYFINDNQFDDEVNKMVCVEIESDFLNKKAKKIIDESNKELINKKVRINVSKESIRHIINMRYDEVAALDYLKNVYDNKIPYKGVLLNKREMANLEIKIKNLGLGNTDAKYRYINVTQSNGRVNTELTNLRSDFKQFIIGEDLHILDIKNSQPLLLNVLFNFINNRSEYPTLHSYLHLLIKNIFSNYHKSSILTDELFSMLETVKLPSEKDLLKYQQLTESGKFYEYIQDWYWQNDYDKYEKEELWKRDNMKDKTFTIFFADKDYTGVIKNIFPTINKFILDVKEVLLNISLKQGKTGKMCNIFPITLQGIESLLWVQNIQTLLDENKIVYYGIHDSVIVPGKDKDITFKLIKSLYSDYQLNPSIDVERNIYVAKKNKDIKKKRPGFDILFETK